MTLQKIFDLKFNKKMPTVKLQRNFPSEAGKIAQVSLAELPARTLKRLISNKKKLKQLLNIKAILKKRKFYS